MSAVELSRVSLAVGGRQILSDIDFAIPDRCFVGVLGPNGAGKTTLFRALLGLLPVAAGTIGVLGMPVRRGNSAIGYMPQTRALVPAVRRMTGRAVLASSVDGHRWGLPSGSSISATAEIDRVLDLVGASTLASRPIGVLSGGERRLLLAQALIGEPRLLLLDEPLISLDPAAQGTIIALIRDVQARLAISVLFSAHELNPLLSHIDQVLYLGNGKAALGPASTVVTTEVLSRLYGAPIEVVRVGGRIFALSGEHLVDHAAHGHDA